MLASCVIPACATGLLAVDVLRRRDHPAAVQAFAATVVAFVPLLVCPGLAVRGRTVRSRLAALPDHRDPALAVGLAAWATNGAPRSSRVVVALGVVVLGLIAIISPLELSPPTAMFDALGTTPLRRLIGHEGLARLALVVVTLGGVVAVARMPRRAFAVLPALVIAAMVATSIDASVVTARLSAAEERDALGGVERDWVDRNTSGPVTLFLTGERPWTTETRTLFWNRSIDEILSVADVPGGAAVNAPAVGIDPESGLVRDAAGRTLSRQIVAAPSTVTLAGDQLAVMPPGSAHSPGLVLWRVSAPLRVTLRVSGLLPNGDFGGRMAVSVPACRRGHLEATLIGKSGDPIDVTVNDIVYDTLSVPAGTTPTVKIPSRPNADGVTACTFVFETPGYVGSTRIAYVSDG